MAFDAGASTVVFLLLMGVGAEGEGLAPHSCWIYQLEFALCEVAFASSTSNRRTQHEHDQFTSRRIHRFGVTSFHP